MNNTESKNILIKWFVLITDIIAYVILVFLCVGIMPDYVSPAVLHHPDVASALGVLCLFSISLACPSVVHRRRMRLGDAILRNFIIAVGTQGVFGLLWHFITVETSNEIVYCVIMSGGLFVALLLLRMVERFALGKLRSSGRNSRGVLFVGNDPANKQICDYLVSDPTTGYRVVGYYSNGIIDNAPDVLIKLGDREEFSRMLDCKEGFPMGVNELYCSLSHTEDEEMIKKIILFCDRGGIRFIYVPRIVHNIELALKPEIMGDSVVYTNHMEPLMAFPNRLVKRLFDIALSIGMLVVLLPLLPLIALAIKIQSPGPILFRQERTGMNGKVFTCYKFRSMHVNEMADRLQATMDDPRKFAFGNFMRKYNIDELPQFVNVLRGDMSVVGPRPHMLIHTEKYASLINKYMVRHFVKPGITGLAQVSGFRGETEELWQMEGRVRKDIYYIDNWTFWLDIQICIKTIFTMFIHDEKAY